MTSRAGDALTHDEENRLRASFNDAGSEHLLYGGDGARVRKTEYTNGAASLTDTFDAANGATWIPGANQTIPFNDNGQSVVKSVGTNVDWNSYLYRTAFSLSHEQSASIDFKVDAPDTWLHLALESTDGGTYSRWAVLATDRLFVQYAENDVWAYPQDLINPVKLNTWYRATLRVDDVNGFRIEVRERDGAGASASYSRRMPAGKRWRFFHAIYRNTAYLDNYVERTDSSTSTYYVGNWYEVTKSAAATTPTKYYYFGSQRVAMKRGSDPAIYLYGDHLGSTSVTADGSGTQTARQTYYANGTVRTTDGLPTDYTFTGQKLDASTGLMYYGARYYDAAQGRFTTRDTWEGDQLNPLTLNAWNYTNGNPVNYTDPTGRFMEEGEVEKGGAEYSCNCGWLDWNHVFQSFSSSNALLNNLKYAADSYRPDWALRDIWGFYYGLPLRAGPVGTDLFAGTALVPNRSLAGENDRSKLGVSIFMDANEQFEQKQGDLGLVLNQVPYAGAKLRNSYFSEEDLPSDIIGYEASLQLFGGRELNFEQFKGQIREACGAVGKTASLDVFRDTYGGGALAENNWRNWSPRLVPLRGCSSGLCSGSRAWPAQFSALTSLRIRPQQNGMWWWYADARDGALVQAGRPKVFRLSVGEVMGPTS